jgi:hypothetical protein
LGPKADMALTAAINGTKGAFNHALSLLGVVDRNDPLCDMVAREVIEVGASGISEPREVAEMAVARIGLR